MERLRKHMVRHLRAVGPVVAALLFAGAYTQSRLFSFNQNTYFVHGLAAGGFGHLESDWLANQTDPTPAFSALVTLIHAHGRHWMFYAVHGALCAIYVLSLYAIARRASAGDRDTPAEWVLLFFASMVFLHVYSVAGGAHRLGAPGALLPLAQKVDGVRRLLTEGVATQFILGPILQPSAFGVLLVASIALFTHEREVAAIFCAASAGVMAPTYVWHAALLTVAYGVVAVSEGRARKAVAMGGLALVLVVPVVAYTVIAFAPTNPSVYSQAQALLVEARIPHHAKVSEWLGVAVWLQLGVILLGLASSRRCSRLFAVLTLSAAGCALLTILQISTGNLSLALLFPWRVTAWLVPVSTAIVMARIWAKAARLLRGAPRTGVAFLSIGFLILAFAGGVLKTLVSAGRNRYLESVIAYAKAHGSADDTYLIPLNFEDFRLAAGVPVFVDWKSHPYRDSELLEWYERVRLARAFYEANDAAGARAALDEIEKRAHITHVVVNKSANGFPTSKATEALERLRAHEATPDDFKREELWRELARDVPDALRPVYDCQDAVVYRLRDPR
jgi:hypothetical protein